MEYKHCTSIREIENQVGSLDAKVRKYIEDNFKKYPQDWYTDVAAYLFDVELEQIVKSGFTSKDNINMIIVGYRVKNFMLGLDEANTLHVLKMYNDRRKQNNFLIDLFKDQEFEDGIQWNKVPYIRDKANSTNALEQMYEAEDEVSRLMYEFLLQDDRPTLALSSASALDNLIKKG